jgi:hypothetical protein
MWSPLCCLEQLHLLGHQRLELARKTHREISVRKCRGLVRAAVHSGITLEVADELLFVTAPL